MIVMLINIIPEFLFKLYLGQLLRAWTSKVGLLSNVVVRNILFLFIKSLLLKYVSSDIAVLKWPITIVISDCTPSYLKHFILLWMLSFSLHFLLLLQSAPEVLFISIKGLSNEFPLAEAVRGGSGLVRHQSWTSTLGGLRLGRCGSLCGWFSKEWPRGLDS